MNYYGTTVWMGYAEQPAAQIIGTTQAQLQFRVTGHGIVADIDTGVDFSHPALQGILMQGYDFTRNRVGGDEMADMSGTAAATCSSRMPIRKSESIDPPQFLTNRRQRCSINRQPRCWILRSMRRFGHGTMVMGIIHLVAPKAMLMPLKAFHSDGTAYTSDILRAIYFAVQNNANVINMSFDFTSPDAEISTAISSAEKSGIVLVASSGNDGAAEVVYPGGTLWSNRRRLNEQLGPTLHVLELRAAGGLCRGAWREHHVHIPVRDLRDQLGHFIQFAIGRGRGGFVVGLESDR